MAPSRSSRPLALLACAALILLLLAWPGQAQSFDVAGQLPKERQYTSAAWTGALALLFGGMNKSVATDEIVRYDPASGVAAVASAKLPTPRIQTSAVWDPTGRVAYVFGGAEGATFHNTILKYDPASDALTILPTLLPSGRAATSAVWGDGAAYIFGGGGAQAEASMGVEPNPHTAQVLKFDPGAALVTVVGQLPSPRKATSAVWADGKAYVFGGDNPTTRFKEIVEFDPGTGTSTVLAADLSTARYYTSAVFDGASAFVFGGDGGGGVRRAETFRFDPVSKSVERVGRDLPTARSAASATWAGSSAVILGGSALTGPLQEILRFTPASTTTPTTTSAGAPSPTSGGGTTSPGSPTGQANPTEESKKRIPDAGLAGTALAVALAGTVAIRRRP